MKDIWTERNLDIKREKKKARESFQWGEKVPHSPGTIPEVIYRLEGSIDLLGEIVQTVSRDF